MKAGQGDELAAYGPRGGGRGAANCMCLRVGGVQCCSALNSDTECTELSQQMCHMLLTSIIFQE